MQKEYLYVIIAGILSGLVVFGGNVLANFGLSLYQISLFPFAFCTIILSFFLIFNRKYRFQKKNFNLLLLYGLVYTIITLAQFGAVILGVSVAIVVFLLYTQPLWTLLFTRVFTKEKITKKGMIACVVVLLGMIILINPFQVRSSQSWLGIIVALIGGISLSGWVVLGSIASKRGNNPINTIFFGNTFMIILLLLLHPLASRVIHDPSLVNLSLNIGTRSWIYVLLFGLLIGVVNQLFYLKGVRKVPTLDAGIILLLEPLSAAILAAIFLGQAITTGVIIGGLLILSANYLVLKKVLI